MLYWQSREKGLGLACKKTSRQSWKKAATILKNGGVVAFPTDTVYGLGALVDDSVAIRRIFEIKERPSAQALPVLTADVVQAMSIADTVPEVAHSSCPTFGQGLSLWFSRVRLGYRKYSRVEGVNCRGTCA